MIMWQVTDDMCDIHITLLFLESKIKKSETDNQNKIKIK